MKSLRPNIRPFGAIKLGKGPEISAGCSRNESVLIPDTPNSERIYGRRSLHESSIEKRATLNSIPWAENDDSQHRLGDELVENRTTSSTLAARLQQRQAISEIVGQSRPPIGVNNQYFGKYTSAHRRAKDRKGSLIFQRGSARWLKKNRTAA